MAALLLALLVAATGISRPVDADLTAIAEQRVIEIQAPDGFDHDLARSDTAEVLAWNRGMDDPLAGFVDGWRNSPTHWAILSDPAWSHIGCAVAIGGDDRYYAACVLSSAARPPAPPAPSAPPSAQRFGGSSAMSDTAVAPPGGT